MSEQTATTQTTDAPVPQHFQRVNTATLIIGVSGSGKTSVLHTFFEYVWETYKRVTLFYSSDGGAFPTLIQRDIHNGIARVWRMRTRSGKDLAFETCYKATRGYWPKRINPLNGEVDPNVELVAPVRMQFEMFCPNGHLVKNVPAEQLLTPQMCPVQSCRVLTNLSNARVTKSITPQRGFEQVGGVAYDGLTSMCSWMQNELGQRAGRLELKGEEAAIGGKVVSGDMAFGGSTRSHVGFVQERSQELVNNALSIPNLVASPVFTALSMEALDEGNLSIRGPRLAGKAKADEAQAWFGNVLETAVVGSERPGERIRRLYLSEFIDGDNVRHLLKNSGSGALPPWIEDPPEDPNNITPQFSGFNLGNFFRMLDQDLTRAMQIPMPGAPGLPAGIVEIGDPATIQQGSAVQQVTAPQVSQPTGAPVAQPAVQQGTAQQPAPQQASIAAPRAPAPKGRAKAPARPAAAAPGTQTQVQQPQPAQPPAQQALPVEGTAAPVKTEPSAQPPQAAPAQQPAAAAPAVQQNAPVGARAAAPPPAAPRPPAAAPRVPPRAAR